MQFSTDNKFIDSLYFFLIINSISYLFASGEHGKIYEWDLRMRMPIDCFADKGSPVTTAMKVSENYLVTGVNKLNY